MAELRKGRDVFELLKDYRLSTDYKKISKDDIVIGGSIDEDAMESFSTLSKELGFYLADLDGIVEDYSGTKSANKDLEVYGIAVDNVDSIYNRFSNVKNFADRMGAESAGGLKDTLLSDILAANLGKYSDNGYANYNKLVELREVYTNGDQRTLRGKLVGLETVLSEGPIGDLENALITKIVFDSLNKGVRTRIMRGSYTVMGETSEKTWLSLDNRSGSYILDFTDRTAVNVPSRHAVFDPVVVTDDTGIELAYDPHYTVPVLRKRHV